MESSSKNVTPNHSGNSSSKYDDLLLSCYCHHLLKCCDILRNSASRYSHDEEYDLYAISYVISDLAISVAHKDRVKASNIFLDYLFRILSVLYPEETADDFLSRIDFYASVIRGITLHAHCLPGVDISDANPVTCCAIAFCDCLMNPTYTSDYSAWWPPMFDTFYALEIATNIFKPLNSELAALYNDMYVIAE